MIFLEKKREFSFPSSNKIKSKKDFQFVYTKGRSVVDSMSVMYVINNEDASLKIGFAVGKKMGNAVVRNRIKRLMREVFRKRRSELKESTKIIWVARKKLATASIDTYDRIFMRLVKRAGLLK